MLNRGLVPTSLARLFLLGLCACQVSDSAFSRMLKTADIHLALGDDKAARIVLDRMDGGSSVSRWASILKREHRLMNQGTNPHRYAARALKASRRSTSLSLRALAAQALLASGQIDKAASLISGEESNSASTSLASIALAIRLSSLQSLGSDAALSLPAQAWIQTAVLSENPSFRMNAALSLLARDQGAAARDQLRAAMAAGAPLSPELAFSAGLYEECLSILGQGNLKDALKPGLYADAAYLSGRRDLARRLWLQSLEEGSNSQQRAFHNLQVIETDPTRKEELLRQALSLFPQEAGPLLDLAGYLADRGSQEEAASLCSQLLALPEPPLAEISLLKLRIVAIEAEAAAVEARLFKELSQKPDSPALSEYTSLELLALGRPAAGLSLLKEIERRSQAPAYSRFVHACLSAAQGREAQALELFDSIDSGYLLYPSLLNSARLLSRSRAWEEARIRLDIALASAPDEAQAAAVYVLIGDSQRQEGKMQAAAAAYRAALSRDSGNRDALRSLAELKESNERKETDR